MIQDVKEIKEIKEVPYAIPDKNINDIDLPISIEIIPHKAILITNATIHKNNSMCTIYKCIFITCFSIPAVLVLISFFVKMP
jgi:hypothetical protein